MLKLFHIILSASILCLCSCQSQSFTPFHLQQKPLDSGLPKELSLLALPSDQSIHIDGRLDEDIWKTARVHALTLSADQQRAPQEKAEVQLCVSPTHLYLAVHCVDSDVVQESHQDQDNHFSSGDVVELFIKPKHAQHYWEIFVTPNEKRSAFFFHGGGRQFLPSAYRGDPSWVNVAAKVEGSLNHVDDTDRGWSAEMAIPLEQLSRKGFAFSPEQAWVFLVGRYNYSVHLPSLEISMFPQLPITSFHHPESWASLIIPQHKL